jgi:hypothetical protein
VETPKSQLQPPQPTTIGITTKQNSSAVTPANILSPDPTTTTTQQTSLLGLFPGELAKLHAENAIEKTATASMNIVNICPVVVDLI